MLDRLDRFQQRHAPVALPVAVSKRFGEHDGSRLAATVSYYSFFSVFPLMLVFVTVLGIVLEDNDDLREDLIDGAVGRIPLIGSQLADDTMPGSGWVLVLGLATAIWAGLAAVSALQHALDVVADVPVHERPNFVMKRVRALRVPRAVRPRDLPVDGRVERRHDLRRRMGDGRSRPRRHVRRQRAAAGDDVLGAAGTPAAVAPPAARRRWSAPRCSSSCSCWRASSSGGSSLGASDVAGTFATVIALLSWFHLVSRVILMSAQLNEVLADDLTPRRLLETCLADRRRSPGHDARRAADPA